MSFSKKSIFDPHGNLLLVSFSSQEPNIAVFHALRHAVLCKHWDIDVHATEASKYHSFEVYYGNILLFSRKERCGYPDLNEIVSTITKMKSGERHSVSVHSLISNKTNLVHWLFYNKQKELKEKAEEINRTVNKDNN